MLSIILTSSRASSCGRRAACIVWSTERLTALPSGASPLPCPREALRASTKHRSNARAHASARLRKHCAQCRKVPQACSIHPQQRLAFTSKGQGVIPCLESTFVCCSTLCCPRVLLRAETAWPDKHTLGSGMAHQKDLSAIAQSPCTCMVYFESCCAA